LVRFVVIITKVKLSADVSSDVIVNMLFRVLAVRLLLFLGRPKHLSAEVIKDITYFFGS
jgi:hypothetical protein